jgi:hypothetical protein
MRGFAREPLRFLHRLLRLKGQLVKFHDPNLTQSRRDAKRGKTPLPQMPTVETQMGRGGTTGGLQNHFNREPCEPRKQVLTQRRKGAKMGNFNHGWARINTDSLARVPQIQRRRINFQPRTTPNTRTQIEMC